MMSSAMSPTGVLPSTSSSSKTGASKSGSEAEGATPFAGLMQEAEATAASDTLPAEAAASEAAAEREADPESKAPEKETEGGSLPDQLLSLLGAPIHPAVNPPAPTPPTGAAVPPQANGLAHSAMGPVGPWLQTLAAAQAGFGPGTTGPQPAVLATTPQATADAALAPPGFGLPHPFLASGHPGLALQAGLPHTTAQPTMLPLMESLGTLPGMERAIGTGRAGVPEGPAAVDGNGTATPFTLPSAVTATASAALRAAVPMTDAVTLPAQPDAGFGDEFGARVGWIIDQRLGEAQIRVNPEHAGPIDVRIQLDGQRVSAEFSSAQADVRQALEASLGRLRDLLSQQGLQLAHAGVGDGQQHGGQGQGGSHPGGTGTGGAIEGEGIARPRVMRGLVDDYA